MNRIHTDSITLRLYSTDASIYDVQPIAVAIPRTKEELIQVVTACTASGHAVTARGAATGIAGGCLGKGYVIDTSVHLNKILEINCEEGFARVEPGVVPDRLNERIRPHGLYFAPEISTSNRATIGGMVATNAAGSNSLEVGEIQDHILEVELILWNGKRVRFSSQGSTDSIIDERLNRIKNEYARDIESSFPKFKRRASGYSLDALLDANFVGLICGSEGTLGIISEIKVKLSPLPTKKELVVVGFSSLQKALLTASSWLFLKPRSLELIDKKILDAGRKSPKLQSRLTWLENEPEALVICELDDADRLVSLIFQNHDVLFAKKIEDPEMQKEVWEVRKSGLGLLLSRRSYSRAIAFIEDVAVPAHEVANFTEKLQNLLGEYGKEAGIYGHIGAGCLHVRPYIDLRDPKELVTMQQLMEKVGDLLKEFGGVYSGEHGDGLVRTWTNKKMFGERLYEAFFQVKEVFDPHYFMNPGKIVAKNPQGLLDNLKLSPDMPIKEFSTYFDFSREGGFALAVDLCNGNGACRKKEGLMCPSYQATLEEKDSTRGRADALRGLIHGQLPEDVDFDSVMDLCLQCKGCKKECPSQVDMAKMKSEWLYHSKKTCMDYVFGHITSIFRWGAYFSWLTPLVEFLVKRKAPRFARKRFSSLYTPKTKGVGKEVVLFVDSYTEFLTPKIGLAAVKLLERLGYDVICPPWQCCGRPLISKGYLPEAKVALEKVSATFKPYVDKAIPILCLEPSCLSVVVDDIQDFKLNKIEMQSFSAFLLMHKEQIKEHLLICKDEVLVHGHCHQKALFGMEDELMLLRETCAPYVKEIPSGCCGMAGSFGYEKEHIPISKKIAELVLFPYIRSRKPNSIVIANGNSCRSQIENGFDFVPLHIAEFLANQLK